ncbi:MAG: response regulator [Gemmatimonadetes bacterium]|nr:response regulator [Gemmatimonadota bacterium]
MDPRDFSAAKLVLVVDDDPDFCLVMSQLLRLCGFRVAIAANGVEALALLPKHPVSVMMTDLFMPRMDGIELLRNVRKRGAPSPAIIAVTGDLHAGRETTAAAAGLLGAHAVLIKPFNKHQLLQAIEVATAAAAGTLPTDSPLVAG